MPVLYRASIGFLLRHPWQLGLALLGIAIGVAVMVAIDIANQSSRKAFSLSVSAVNGAATHQVVGGPSGLDESVYSNIRVNLGVRDIAPIVSGFVTIGDSSLQLVGVDIFAEGGFRDFSGVSGVSDTDVNAGNSNVPTGRAQPLTIIRRLLTHEGAVFMTALTAQSLHLKLDDTFVVLADGRSYPAVLGGFIGNSNNAALQNIVFSDIAQAQKWMSMQGRLSRIDIRASDDKMLATIRASLPPDASLLTAESRKQATIAMSDAFTTNLTAMSLLALLVGVFLIYNSVSFAVLQRRRLLGVLRALGVSRRQVFVLIMSEAVVLGALGASLGVIIGIQLGEQLVGLVSRTISDHYFVVSVTDTSMSSATFIKGMLAGLGATIVAATIPAIEASSYRPRLSLLRSVVEQRVGRLLPYLATAGIAVTLLALLLLRISTGSLVTGLLAVFAIILGYALCIPIVVRYICNLLTPLAARLGGIGGKMVTSGVAATISRTGVAIVALAIAVSATIGVGVMVNSFRLSVSTWLETTLQADIYVGVARGSLDASLIDEFVSVPGVATFSTARRTRLESPAGRSTIFALQRPAGLRPGVNVRNKNADAVWRQFDGDRAVLVSDPFAFRNNVSAGDQIILPTRTGDQVFSIVSIYQSYDSNDGIIMMSRSNYDQYFSDPGVDSVGLYLEPGYDPELVMQELRLVSHGRQSLLMNSNARIRELSLDVFDRTFVITDVLYWLAVGVAIVGILGALLALQLERAREFGILRAVGMTPQQIGKLVVYQSGFIGLLSGIAAMPLGVIMAVLLIEVINRRAFGWQMNVQLTLSDLAIALGLSVLAAVVAGVFPAWKAARCSPAIAMRHE